HEQGVDVFAVIVFIFKPRDSLARGRHRRSEVEAHRVFTSLQRALRKLNVTVLDSGLRRLSINDEIARAALPKIQQHRRSQPKLKANFLVARSRGSVWRQRKLQVVAKIGNLTRTLPRQVTRNTLRRSSKQVECGDE